MRHNKIVSFFIRNLSNISSCVAIISAMGAMIFWSHSGLANAIQEIKADTKLAHSRIDATNQRIDSHIQAMYKRLDDANTRIDVTYQLILDALNDRKMERRTASKEGG